MVAQSHKPTNRSQAREKKATVYLIVVLRGLPMDNSIMARVARLVVPGIPHHVTQRGNRHQDVFFGREDYRTYLELLT